MAMKKPTKPTTAELLPAAAPDGSPQPLVNLRIERPEPLLAGVQKLFDRVQKFQITSPDAYREAASIRMEIRAEHDAMEKRRVKMKQPTLDAGREIDGYFKPAITVLAEAIEEMTDRMNSYDIQQRRIAEQKQRKAEVEAERVRQEAFRKANEERERTQMAMQEIQGINHQVMIASVGRNGVRKGGTLECIRATLTETENWDIHSDKDRWGSLYEAAQQAKLTAIASIKALESQFIAKQEQDRIAREAAEAKAAGNAERVKQAEADAAIHRQKAIDARKAQMRAEEEQRQATARVSVAEAASRAKVEALEHTAATTVAEEVKADIVQVAGLSRPKVKKWRLLDKSKLKSEFTLVDEKTINRIVSTAYDRACDIVGAGAIEVYEEEQLRQGR